MGSCFGKENNVQDSEQFIVKQTGQSTANYRYTENSLTLPAYLESEDYCLVGPIKNGLSISPGAYRTLGSIKAKRRRRRALELANRYFPA